MASRKIHCPPLQVEYRLLAMQVSPEPAFPEQRITQEEMLELVQWVCQVNLGRTPDQQIRIFGVDITAPAMGVRSALDSLTAAGVETRLDARALGLDLHEGDFWPTTWQRYSELPDDRRRELAENFDELMALLSAAKTKIMESSSDEAYERALSMAEIGRMGNALFSSSSR